MQKQGFHVVTPGDRPRSGQGVRGRKNVKILELPETDFPHGPGRTDRTQTGILVHYIKYT